MWKIWDVANPSPESIPLNLAKTEYPDLFRAVTDAMLRQDPIGLYRGKNTSECEAAATVIPRLKYCSSEADVATVLQQEFSKWFDWKRAGARARYADLASEIWKLRTETKAKPR